jgi:virginiamycin B lyase
VRRGRTFAIGVIVGAAVLTFSVTDPVGADPLGEITTIATGGVTAGFSANSLPEDVTTGSDGNLWFLESSTEALARVNGDGTVSEFPVPGGGSGISLSSIVAGPDGALWFTGFNGPGNVFRATTDGNVTAVATGGVTPGFPSSNVQGIAVGPDGNVWVTRPSFTGSSPEGLARITPGGAITLFGAAAGLPDDATLRYLTAGADGNLYVTDSGQGQNGGNPVAGRVWRFNLATNGFELVATAGTTSGFTAGNVPNAITSGPDGNLWFLFFSGTHSGIARMTAGGEVTEFTDGIDARGVLERVTTACDGALWFTQSREDESEGAVYRTTTSGSTTSYRNGLPPNASIVGITNGPDRNVWVTNFLDPGNVLRVGTGACATPVQAASAPDETIEVTPSFTG